REEMAQTLSDVVFRRTNLGAMGIPDDKTLNACAGLMAHELSWDKAKVEKEISDLKSLVLKI
ncbi:MAG: glycerol-3-phosphate dehydrogenase C-terminal domain-containing protein, partial [Thermodesulfovibrionales bacterium]